MNNYIFYYYNLKPDQINEFNGYYSFYIENNLFNLVTYYRNFEELKDIYELNIYMSNSKINVHNIILNKNNEIITYINNIPYILYKINIINNKKISLYDINYLSKFNYNRITSITRNDWDILWANRVDFLEYHLNQNGKKYPIIVESFSYFIGMCENAISYVKNAYNEAKKDYSDNYVISHEKLIYNNNTYSLYNPLNIIIDHKSRDISEYIKLSFFNDNFNIFNELREYFKYNYYSEYGIRLLFARVMYPSFYFDLYDQIVIEVEKEEKMLEIINRINEYEIYLKKIFLLLNKIHPIPEIEWLIKKTN